MKTLFIGIIISLFLLSNLQTVYAVNVSGIDTTNIKMTRSKGLASCHYRPHATYRYYDFNFKAKNIEFPKQSSIDWEVKIYEGNTVIFRVLDTDYRVDFPVGSTRYMLLQVRIPKRVITHMSGYTLTPRRK